MLEGYVLTNVGGGWLIGRLQQEEKVAGEDRGLGGPKLIRRFLKPAYEASVEYLAGPDGSFGVQPTVMPLLGSPNLRSIDLPPTAVFLRCEDMSAKERERWSASMQQADAVIQALRAAESGIVMAGAGTKLPSAERLGLVRG